MGERAGDHDPLDHLPDEARLIEPQPQLTAAGWGVVGGGWWVVALILSTCPKSATSVSNRPSGRR